MSDQEKPVDLQENLDEANQQPAVNEASVPVESEQTDDYSAANIRVLEGLEAVRKRPGMYIGGTGITGCKYMVDG